MEALKEGRPLNAKEKSIHTQGLVGVMNELHDELCTAELTSAAAALPLSAIEASFKGRGPWKKSLPRILETLEALGRARREGDAWRG